MPKSLKIAYADGVDAGYGRNDHSQLELKDTLAVMTKDAKLLCFQHRLLSGFLFA
jgi:hypothetical protein